MTDADLNQDDWDTPHEFEGVQLSKRPATFLWTIATRIKCIHQVFIISWLADISAARVRKFHDQGLL